MAAVAAQAAHPLLTEDTGTQGAGRFELELGFQQARDGGSKASEFGPQLSYGVAETLDLVVRPAWLDLRLASQEGGARASGFGDTGVDFKWRIYEREALALGLRAGADLPTGNAGKGLGNDRVSPHAILIATLDAAPWTISGNLDYARDPLVGDRRNLFGASVAAVLAPDERWKLSAEVGAASNPDPARATWPAVARIGAIATVAPGLDVDAGWQRGLNRAAPARTLLAGATLRW